jgi:uncharacterized protein YndB with AHSA1/START domain
MRVILIILGILVALVAVAALIGSRLPEAHVARGSIVLRQPREAVWEVIANIEGQPSWRKDLKKVERVDDPSGVVWRETTSDALLLKTTEIVAPTRLVRTIADSTLPFGGRWIYELADANGGTRVTVTEEGEVYNPIFRLISRFMDQRATLTAYLTALGARFGESVTVE